MFPFLKSNSYIIVKMFVNQIGITVFGLVLAMATSQNEKLLLLTSIFSILFYLFLLYTMSWEAGISDKIRVDAGRMQAQPYKYFLLSFIANILNLVLGILAVFGYMLIDKSADIWLEPEWAVNLYSICNAIARFIQGMYLGAVQYFTPNNPISLILIAFPAIIVCGFGYLIGLRGYSIRSIFGIKAGSPKENSENSKNKE
ncbi:MAG: hypothetical protein PHZ09_08115 [Eubacteriales bacterium]|nr:hypothetical protein [Eubacteriales bacterium]